MEEAAQIDTMEDQSTIRLGKRCFVGNLAWKTSWQDLKDKFRECGNVVYTNVMRDDDGEKDGSHIQLRRKVLRHCQTCLARALLVYLTALWSWNYALGLVSSGSRACFPRPCLKR